jgi:hypothetical protein
MSAEAGAVVAHADGADEEDRVASLPASLVHNIFSRLPADERARCATVRRSWRTAVAERGLWTRLDLSASSGVTCTVNDAALAAAAARAGGRLEALDLCGRNTGRFDSYSHTTVRALAAANSDTLLELCCHVDTSNWRTECAELESLLRAAPRLRVLETSAYVQPDDAGRMLRNEPPFGPLRLTKLSVSFPQADVGAALSVLAAVLAHVGPLASLHLEGASMHNDAVLNAVVDAVLARRMSHLSLTGAPDWEEASPAAVLALARLLGSDVLEELELFGGLSLWQLDAPGAALLAAALRANTTLTSLALESALCRDPAAATALLRGLTVHPSLCSLEVRSGMYVDDVATCDAVAALVAVNAPSLTDLTVHQCFIQDAALAPLLEALRVNTHLRRLDCSGNGMSAAFARDVLLPAVRANAGLTALTAVTSDEDANILLLDVSDAEEARARQFQAEAEALVAARP